VVLRLELLVSLVKPLGAALSVRFAQSVFARINCIWRGTPPWYAGWTARNEPGMRILKWTVQSTRKAQYTTPLLYGLLIHIMAQ
jgi:hypothetical protein